MQHEPEPTPAPPAAEGRRRFLAGAALLAGGAALGTATGPAARPAEGAAEAGRVVRTPDARFRNLPDYPFAPHYVHVQGGDGVGGRLRAHYLDEGPAGPARPTGETVVLLHGEPSWSYLWRHVVPPLVAAGHRCIAPDLIGFGRSDKPTDRFAYTYQRHVDWLREALFDRLDLRDITLVCHDWGGMLGLRLLAEHPDRFRRVVASNTGFDTGDEVLPPAAWEYLAQWLQVTQRADPFRPSGVLDDFTLTPLAPAVLAAYEAPFPDNAYLEGARRFPLLIPLTPDDENTPALRAAWAVLTTLRTPFLCAFSDRDHVTNGQHGHLSDHIPGAQGQPHATITGAAHFLQEDRPAEFAAVIDGFIRATA